MKHAIFYFLLMCCSFFASAQDSNTVANPGKNIIKLNLPALALKNISVQYERAIARKITLAATVRFMPDGSIPFKSAVVNLVDDIDFERQINNFSIGNVAVIPEVRFYLGKKGAFRGFYVAPFASIARYNTKLLLEFDAAGATKNIPLDGSINTITGGLMFGAQWKLSKRLYLDWWILGPNYGSSKGDITGKKSLTALEQQAVRDELAGLEVPLTEFTYVVDANGATINFNGPWGGVRSGICLGIRF